MQTSKAKPFRIAILDDARTTLHLLTRILEQSVGCSTISFSDGNSLLASEATVDLYLLDIRMPGINGIDVCRILRERPDSSDVPIIFLSAGKEPETRLKALRAGAIDFVDKPFFPEELVLRVEGQVKLHRYRQQLRQQLEEKKTLLRVLCHDLKNPVGAASSFLELAQINDESNELEVSSARLACDSALELIAHVAEFHKLEEAQAALPLETVRIKEAVEESIRINSPKAAQKDLSIETNCPGELFILVNRVALVHNLLNNLLSNSVKFTPAGGTIRVSADFQPETEPPACRIEVADDGVGIPEGILNTLFEPGPTRSTEGTDGELGSGMGLVLAKIYAERCGGTLEISSQTDAPSRGTTATLSFPMACGDPLDS